MSTNVTMPQAQDPKEQLPIDSAVRATGPNAIPPDKLFDEVAKINPNLLVCLRCKIEGHRLNACIFESNCFTALWRRRHAA